MINIYCNSCTVYTHPYTKVIITLGFSTQDWHNQEWTHRSIQTILIFMLTQTHWAADICRCSMICRYLASLQVALSLTNSVTYSLTYCLTHSLPLLIPSRCQVIGIPQYIYRSIRLQRKKPSPFDAEFHDREESIADNAGLKTVSIIEYIYLKW